MIRLGDTGAGVRVRWEAARGNHGKARDRGGFRSGRASVGNGHVPAVPASVVTDEKNAVRVDLPLTAKALVPAARL